MLIDHALSIKGLSGNSRLGKRKFLWLLSFILTALFLLFFSCFNLKLFQEREIQENPFPASSVPVTIEPPVQELPESIIKKKTLSVSSGDTLIELMAGEGMDRTTARMVIATLKNVFNPRDLRQGQDITLAFEIPENNEPLFHSLTIRLDATSGVQVTRSPENVFISKEISYELEARPVQARAEISSSLYVAAREIGMPIEVLIEMIRAYSFDVDFQRDIRPGDKFEALYEKLFDENGNFVRGGSILYASLNTNGRTLPIFRYETSDGEVDLFNEKGQSIRKTLMVTPIDGARLSSGYGMRRHPILGYSRMHKGLDFAAPTGTPIMAAGDGVIEYAGRKGSYGKYIRIRHANEYKTVFGHMSRFTPGIKKGVRVKQGQIIGYVGSTGVSTGPHLHYEVIHRRKNINPASLKTPPGRTLKGDELERFLQAKSKLETLYASLDKGKKMAGI